MAFLIRASSSPPPRPPELLYLANQFTVDDWISFLVFKDLIPALFAQVEQCRAFQSLAHPR